MSADLIGLAEQEKAAAEQRVQQLEEELARKRQEITTLQSFIEIGNRLSSALHPKQETQTSPSANGAPPKITVQSDSWAGLAAKLILSKGPLTLDQLMVELQAMGKGAKLKKPAASVYSALWRRKDVFVQKAGVFNLLTKEIDFV